ncbi:MAG: hypothetical protein VB835_11645, partial [Pirellulales bacterium]
GGQLIAASSGALGTADGGTTLIGGGELGLQGGITLAGEALSIPDDATVFSADANQNTLGGSVVASMDSNVITLRADSAAGGLVIGGGVDMGGGKLITDGPGDITIMGDIIGASQRRVTGTTPNVLNAYAYDVSSGGNGDDNLANIGNPGAEPSLLERDPISHIEIDGNFIIRYDNDDQFRNGAGHPSKGFANSLDGLPGLNQNDNYATLFTATLVVPDLNNGQPYTIEFGTHRADDPAYFFLDKNQNGIIESAQGEQVAARGCCGNVFASTSVAPGKYLYIASHLERGGGSQIEPTIDLTPDPHGRRTVRAFDAARPGLFESVQSSIVPADNSLMKMGDGTLRIAGKTVYNGDTTVMAGILEVDGKLREPFRAADLKDDLATITPFTAVADFKDDVAGFSPEVPVADLQDDVAAFDPLELEANYRDGFAGADFPDNWEYLTNVGTNDLASVSTTVPNTLQGYAFNVQSDNNDHRLGNIGFAGGNGILNQDGTPDAGSLISHITIDGNDTILYTNDGQFRNGTGESQGFGNSEDGLPGLQQNDNFATAFVGEVVIPDLNNGNAYNVEFGTHRSDDPVQIWVDLDQNGLFEHGQAQNFNPGGVSGPYGDMVLNRDCCGNGWRTIQLAPGTYMYAATMLERGGGSQIEPT